MTEDAGYIRVTARADADPVELLRAAIGASVVLMIDPAMGATATAMARAAVPAIASERTPYTRINAVAPSDRADPAAIDLAVTFLHGSPAITGQVLDLT